MVAHLQQSDDDTFLQGVPVAEDAFERLISGESPYRYELIEH